MRLYAKFKRGIPNFMFEVIVIIIGVLLSLAISDWVQNRKDHRKETKYLEQIRDDLQDDLARLEQGLKLRGQQLNFVSTTLATINDRDQQPNIVELTNGLQVMITTEKFSPSNVTFRSLESTGQLSLIENESVLTGLIDLYTNGYNILQQNNDDVTAYRNNFFLPYVIENVNINGVMLRRQVGNTFDILEESTFQNHLAYNQVSLFSTQGAYKRAIREVEALLALVNKELEG